MVRYLFYTIGDLTYQSPLVFTREALRNAHSPSPMVQQPLAGQGLVICEDSRSHSVTPHSVGLLWTSDQPDAETSTLQSITLTGDRHPCPRRDSNPQSQQASGLRLRLRTHGHWDRPSPWFTVKKFYTCVLHLSDWKIICM